VITPGSESVKEETQWSAFVSGWEPYKKTGSGGVLVCAIGAYSMAFWGRFNPIVDGVEVDLRKAITPRRPFWNFRATILQLSGAS
jgi:hypothetical protein